MDIDFVTNLHLFTGKLELNGYFLFKIDVV